MAKLRAVVSLVILAARAFACVKGEVDWESTGDRDVVVSDEAWQEGGLPLTIISSRHLALVDPTTINIPPPGVRQDGSQAETDSENTEKLTLRTQILAVCMIGLAGVAVLAIICFCSGRPQTYESTKTIPINVTEVKPMLKAQPSVRRTDSYAIHVSVPVPPPPTQKVV